MVALKPQPPNANTFETKQSSDIQLLTPLEPQDIVQSQVTVREEQVEWLLDLLQSYPGSRWGNRETRGLDTEFAAETYVKQTWKTLCIAMFVSDGLDWWCCAVMPVTGRPHCYNT